jgi:hypothetical protein
MEPVVVGKLVRAIAEISRRDTLFAAGISRRHFHRISISLLARRLIFEAAGLFARFVRQSAKVVLERTTRGCLRHLAAEVAREGV